jgi:hypothetical protein
MRPSTAAAVSPAVGPVPLPEFAAVRQQTACRMAEDVPEREFGGGHDLWPVLSEDVPIARPENVVLERGEQVAVLVELDLVGRARLARIDGIALRGHERVDQTVEHRPGPVVRPEHGHGQGDHGLVAKPLPVVLPDRAVEPPRARDRRRELSPGGREEPVEELVAE